MKTAQPANPCKPNDQFSLIGATQNNTPLPTWDGGYGQLYIIHDNCGAWSYPIGIVRAQSWEEAYEIATDEIFPGPSADDMAEYEAACALVEDDNYPDLPEGWHYRANGTPANEKQFPHIHSIYAVSSLDIANPVQLATPTMLADLSIIPVFSL